MCIYTTDRHVKTFTETVSALGRTNGTLLLCSRNLKLSALREGLEGLRSSKERPLKFRRWRSSKSQEVPDTGCHTGPSLTKVTQAIRIVGWRDSPTAQLPANLGETFRVPDYRSQPLCWGRPSVMKLLWLVHCLPFRVLHQNKAGVITCL